MPPAVCFLTGVTCNVSVVLICISFLAKDIEHFFMLLLAICTSKNDMFNLFAYLLIGLFVLLGF
jgi:hypothetical protein